MVRVEFYLTRDDFEDRVIDSAVDCDTLDEALVSARLLVEANPGAVVCIGRW